MTRKYIDNAFHHNTPLSALKFAKNKKKANSNYFGNRWDIDFN